MPSGFKHAKSERRILFHIFKNMHYIQSVSPDSWINI